MKLFFKKIYGKILYYSAKVYTPEFEGRYLSEFKDNFKKYRDDFLLSIYFYIVNIWVIVLIVNHFKKSPDSIFLGAMSCICFSILVKQSINFVHRKIENFLSKNSRTKSLGDIWSNQKLRIFVPLIIYFYSMIIATPVVLVFLSVLNLKLLIMVAHPFSHILGFKNLFLTTFVSVAIDVTTTISSIIIGMASVVFFVFLCILLIQKTYDKILFLKQQHGPVILDKDVVITKSKKDSIRELDGLLKK